MKIGFYLLAICLIGSLMPIPAYADAFDQPRTIGDSVGVDVDDYNRKEEEFQRVKESGFGYARISLRWEDVEKTRDDYNWRKVDAYIAALRAAGLKAVIIIWGGNALYSGTMAVPYETFHQSRLPPSPVSESDIQAFAVFAATAARRYAGDDIIWEIWNEPNGDAFWVPQPDAKAYARVASSTCDAMRTAVPNAIIVGPGLSKLPSTSGEHIHDFIEEMYDHTVASCLDGFSVHPYRYRDQIPETVIDEYAASKKIIANHTPRDGKPLPLVDSEWGYSTTFVTPEEQAAYVLRSLFTNFISGIPLSIIYHWKDTYDGPMDDREAHFGLIQFDGDPNPAFTAVHDILPRIHDAVFERRLATSDPETYVISFRQPDGKRTLAYWTSRSFSDPSRDLVIKLGSTTAHYIATPMPQLADIGSATPVIVSDKAQPSTPPVQGQE